MLDQCRGVAVWETRLISDFRMEPPALVFHQGPLHTMQARMTVCSIAVHMPCTQ
jgi:hypothetical protein